MAWERLRMDQLANAWVGDRNTPFQIGLLGIFEAGPFLDVDGGLDTARVRAELAARARRVPQLGGCVVWTRVGEGRPVWASGPSFDPGSHFGSVTLPPGANLYPWAAARFVRPLDLTRPLWRAEVVDGLPGGRFAVVIVVHHILADATEGLAIIASLLDPGPAASGTLPAPSPVPPLPSRRDLLADRLRQALTALRRHGDGKGRPARRHHGVRQFRDMLATFPPRAAVTTLPRHIGPGRNLVVVTRPLDAVHDAGHVFGVTVTCCWPP